MARKVTTLDQIIDACIKADRGTFAPYWALALFAAFNITGTVTERSQVVASEYTRRIGNTPQGRKYPITDSSVRQLVACAKLWSDAVIDNVERQNRMHPFTAYAHRAAAKGEDGKRLEGEALGQAYDSISGTAPRSKRDEDGMANIRVSEHTKVRLQMLAEASGMSVGDIVANLLDTHANTAA